MTTAWIRRWESIRRRLPTVNPVIMGHPLHALSTDLPAALIPTGFAFSLWGRIARQPDLEKAGYLNTAAGVAIAIPTALFGLADYLQMEVDDPAQTTGLTHGLLNMTVLGVGHCLPCRPQPQKARIQARRLVGWDFDTRAVGERL